MSTPKLLATDWMFSPLSAHTASSRPKMAYTVYGHRAAPEGLPVTGFTGQLCESGLGGYLLGNGYRAYSPVLMRFHSPDRVSPFDKGGINAYAYCAGNPVCLRDPSGQVGQVILAAAANFLGYSVSLTTSLGAFNRRADQVVDSHVNPAHVKPTFANKVGNTAQFWGGIAGGVGRTVLLSDGLSDAPQGAQGISTYAAQSASSLGTAAGGALLTQPVMTGWVDKAQEHKLPVRVVVAETLYKVSGMEMVVEGAQVAAGLVASGANAAGGLLASGASALYNAPTAAMNMVRSQVPAAIQP